MIRRIRRRRWLSRYLAWRRALRSARFADDMPVPEERERLLIVAPHPDDETLGCGGLIQASLAAGAEVHVVLMTNGDGSELSLILGEGEVPWKPGAFAALGRKRQQESLRALSLAGLPASHVHFLGYPNNALLAIWRPENWPYSSLYRSPYTRTSFSPYERAFTPGAPYCGQQVLSDLISVMNQVRPDAIFVTHPRDVHPDHFATYMFVRYALATAAARGAAWAQTARAYGYLVHWPRYPGPASLTTGRALLPPPGLSRDTTQWLRFPLTRDQRRLKLRQVRAYRSQKPSFDRLLLAFVRENEAFDLLPPQETAPGSRVHWLIPGPRRRGLNGAKVSDVDLTVRENLSVRASLILASRKMPQNGYVCLDLRTWDDAGTPVITATYLRSGNRKSAIRLGRGTQASAIRLGPGTRAKTAPVLVHNASPTQMDILGLKLPSESLARQALFVSCWGSVRDRIISPGVSTLLTFGAPRSD